MCYFLLNLFYFYFSDNLDIDIYGVNLCYEYVKVFDDGSGNINIYEY